MTRILGTVTGPNGEKITEASVYFMDGPVPLPDIAQITDDDGRFRLAAPVPGIYHIGVRGLDAETTAEITVEVHDEPEVEAQVRLG